MVAINSAFAPWSVDILFLSRCTRAKQMRRSSLVATRKNDASRGQNDASRELDEPAEPKCVVPGRSALAFRPAHPTDFHRMIVSLSDFSHQSPVPSVAISSLRNHQKEVITGRGDRL